MANNKGKPHIRTIDKCRVAIRLELKNMGIPASDIAAHIGMTAASFSRLKMTRLYHILKQQYFTGILSIIDADLVNDLEAQRHTLKSAVPVALENLITFATDRTDKRICMEATKEILNRDGHFAAVTRIGLPTGDQGGVGNKEDDKVADELIAALAKRNIEQKKVLETMEVKTDTIQ